jgi:hypothetical protein
METPIDQRKCDTHKEVNIEFYCFDDNSFLCSKCFKDHKKHNIEIVDDLKEKDKTYKSLIAAKLNFSDYYIKIKKVLEKVQSNIVQTLQFIAKKLEELKNSAPPGEMKSIFSLSYKEYEHNGIIAELISNIRGMSNELDKAAKILKKQNDYGNFRAINKEVQVIDQSKILPEFPTDIMFERDNSQEYTLFDGPKNHFIVMDLGKLYYLKSIQIGVTSHDCSLRDFNVLTKNKKGEWERVSQFVCKPDNEKLGLQEFKIGKETQYVRMELLSTWGTKSGNYILIKKIFFVVGDII